MGWIGSLEYIVKQHCQNINLGIAFEFPDKNFKVEKNGVTYYPINLNLKPKDIIKMKFNGNDNWYKKEPLLKNVIDDFNPDIIHCFGSEWNWGLISNSIDVPMVLHMQGFSSIYMDANAKVNKRNLSHWYKLIHPRETLQSIFLKYYDKKRSEIEYKIMDSCKYFMGRTEWDKDIVKFFSPGSQYYYCSEAIRPVIYDSKEKWTYKHDSCIKIITIASAGNLKGNGIILETAKILKRLGINFVWRVSGNKKTFESFERSTGISAKNVNVQTIGFVDVEGVRQELLNAEMFILPSIMDNSPNSLCEAQLIGTPVIASYVGGIPQLVENNISGILYPYNEPYALAFKILNLHNSPELQKEISRYEIEISHNRHKPQLLAKRLSDIYLDVIKRSKNK